MRRVLICVFLVSVFSPGCSTKGKQYFAGVLKDVDKIQLIFFNHGDTLSQMITDPSEIDLYKELMNGKKDPGKKLACDSTGQIRFFHKDDVLIDAWFSTPASGSKFNKPCVTYTFSPEVYRTALTIRSGMDIDDYYYKLRSMAIRMTDEHD